MSTESCRLRYSLRSITDDSAAFEQGIKEMLEKLGLHQDTLLEEDVSDVPQRDCKVQVQELTYTDIANTDQDL